MRARHEGKRGGPALHEGKPMHTTRHQCHNKMRSHAPSKPCLIAPFLLRFRSDPPVERKRPRSGDGTVLCPTQFPGALEPMAANGLIGINSVAPHRSLRQRLPHSLPTKGRNGSRRKWKPVTPAMAAGLTDHVWTMDALLSFRVPPKCL